MISNVYFYADSNDECTIDSFRIILGKFDNFFNLNLHICYICIIFTQLN